MEGLIRTLKIFVIAGGFVLVFGTAYLIWLLATREGPQHAELSPTKNDVGREDIILPRDSTIREMAATSQDIYFLLELPDGGNLLAKIDMDKHSGVVLIPVRSQAQ